MMKFLLKVFVLSLFVAYFDCTMFRHSKQVQRQFLVKVKHLDAPEGVFSCEGALMGPQLIVTSAQCSNESESIVEVHITNFNAYGGYNGVQKIRGQFMAREDYNKSGLFEQDIAVIYLNEPTENTPLPGLCASSSFVMVAVSFEKSRFRGAFDNIMDAQMLEVPGLYCQNEVFYRQMDVESQICTIGPRTCSIGNIGAPLVQVNRTTDEPECLYGILSYKEKGCLSTQVFTRAFVHKRWMAEREYLYRSSLEKADETISSTTAAASSNEETSVEPRDTTESEINSGDESTPSMKSREDDVLSRSASSSTQSVTSEPEVENDNWYATESATERVDEYISANTVNIIEDTSSQMEDDRSAETTEEPFNGDTQEWSTTTFATARKSASDSIASTEEPAVSTEQRSFTQSTEAVRATAEPSSTAPESTTTLNSMDKNLATTTPSPDVYTEAARSEQSSTMSTETAGYRSNTVESSTSLWRR